MPIQVLTPALVPTAMVLSSHPPHTPLPAQLGMGMRLGGGPLLGGCGILSGKSPFRIVPIPSINRTQPEELPNVSLHNRTDGLCLISVLIMRMFPQ